VFFVQAYTALRCLLSL